MAPALTGTSFGEESFCGLVLGNYLLHRQLGSGGYGLPMSSILPAILQIASALQYVHNHGVIHCDIKPQNMLLGPRNQVWLIDFGIATTVTSASGTRYGRREVPGTASYLAPERMHGRPLPASDQYALAVVVYQWLCGVCPFEGSALEI